MTSRDFCYWLQGFFELSGSEAKITDYQRDKIKNHLAMVFKHEIDPSFGGPEVQKELAKIHGTGSATSLAQALSGATVMNC